MTVEDKNQDQCNHFILIPLCWYTQATFQVLTSSKTHQTSAKCLWMCTVLQSQKTKVCRDEFPKVRCGYNNIIDWTVNGNNLMYETNSQMPLSLGGVTKTACRILAPLQYPTWIIQKVALWLSKRWWGTNGDANHILWWSGLHQWKNKSQAKQRERESTGVCSLRIACS